tara:strand:- start:80 stop:325 length:246 start_codon:yes stop_codon:yes gene_type:complete
MKHRKNYYKIGDGIIQYRHGDERIREGIVTKGPFRIENVDHYHVKWDWEHKDLQSNLPWKQNYEDDSKLICDMLSTKYHYN